MYKMDWLTKKELLYFNTNWEKIEDAVVKDNGKFSTEYSHDKNNKKAIINARNLFDKVWEMQMEAIKFNDEIGLPELQLSNLLLKVKKILEVDHIERRDVIGVIFSMIMFCDSLDVSIIELVNGSDIRKMLKIYFIERTYRENRSLERRQERKEKKEWIDKLKDKFTNTDMDPSDEERFPWLYEDNNTIDKSKLKWNGKWVISIPVKNDTIDDIWNALVSHYRKNLLKDVAFMKVSTGYNNRLINSVPSFSIIAYCEDSTNIEKVKSAGMQIYDCIKDMLGRKRMIKYKTDYETRNGVFFETHRLDFDKNGVKYSVYKPDFDKYLEENNIPHFEIPQEVIRVKRGVNYKPIEREYLFGKRVVMLDVETTGLRESASGLLEVAAIEVIYGTWEVIDSFEYLIKDHKNLITTSDFRIHGISPRLLEEMGDTEKYVMNKLNKFIKGKIVIQHTINNFDKRFIDAAFERQKINNDNDWESSIRIFRTIIPNEITYSLSRLYASVITEETSVSHRAMTDVMYMLDIFRKYEKSN